MSDVNFCEDLRDEFASSDRTRGDSYFRTGRVAIGDVAANRVTAKVRGSSNRRYDVDVELDESRENVCGTECSCPQFEMAGCCKHVWAVLRTLDELMHSEAAVSAPTRTKVNDAETREIVQMLNKAGHTVVDGRLVLDGIGDRDGESNKNSGNARAAGDVSERHSPSAPPPPPAPWKMMLDSIQQRVARVQGEQRIQQFRRNSSNTVCYLLDLSIQESAWPILQVHLHDESQSHFWHKMPASTHDELEEYEDQLPPIDANIITELLNANPDSDEDDDYDSNGRYVPPWRRRNNYRPSINYFAVDNDCTSLLLREIVGTGRMYWRAHRTAQPEPLRIESYAVEPLQPRIVLNDADKDQIRMSLQIVAGEKSFPVRGIAWSWESGAVLLPELLGKIDPVYQPWLLHFMQQGDQLLPAEQRDGLIHSLLELAFAPELVWPDSWGLRDEIGVPQPVLKIQWPDRMPRDLSELQLAATPLYRYGEHDFPIGNESSAKVFDPANSRILTRNPEAELAHLHKLLATDRLIPVGVGAVEVEYASIPTLGETLGAIGWLLEAEGRPLVAPGQFSFEVTSGLDWFDLSGGATYVYILDPWWNPAVEAQAIDRAHRIGQTKNVFAYRMIAKGTVEEKIIELQKTKRELADLIISGNNSLIRTLTADDLQMLLG